MDIRVLVFLTNDLTSHRYYFTSVEGKVLFESKIFSGGGMMLKKGKVNEHIIRHYSKFLHEYLGMQIPEFLPLHDPSYLEVIRLCRDDLNQYFDTSNCSLTCRNDVKYNALAFLPQY